MFCIVNKAEIDVFLERSCFFHDPADVGNLITGSSAFSKTSLSTWKFTVHVLLKTDQPRQHIKKQRYYFASKGLSSQGYGFSSSHVWFESCGIKNAERRRIDAFALWCWRILLRVPWTARSSNQSILKEMNPGCSLERLMLKLTLQYFGHLLRRADPFEKTLMLGTIESRRKRG